MREPSPESFANQYERPNQQWVCGHSADGHACPAGPTARGRCPALAECAPRRDGDRWVCNRSTLRGGTCNVGPTPEGGCGCVQTCSPVRSLRAKRSRFIGACAALAAGLLVLALSAKSRDKFIRPGPLAQQHAQILDRTGGAASCAACHAAGAQGVSGWALSLVARRESEPTQSQLCMKCHAQLIPAERALAAHNVDAVALQKIGGGLGTGGSGLGNSKDVACATCHREHHGASVNLAAMDNAACQSCHRQKFQSFASDHPDFGMWPYERRTRIAFNHASHQAKHFAEKKQAFDCRACHVSDSTGRVERLADYAQACASCHDEKIATSIGKGVPMFVLPTLDVAAMNKAGRDIGAWPQGATGDFDGKLPPAMKFLLANDPAAAAAMKSLGAGFDFQDVDPGDAEQVKAAADIAVAVTALASDLGKRGPVAVRERLVPVAARYQEADADELLAGLSVDTARSVAAWLPGIDVGREPWQRLAKPGLIEQGVGARGTNDASRYQPKRIGDAKTLSARGIHFDRPGEWIRDDSTFAIRYRPAGHADPVLAAWLDQLASTPGLENQPVAAAMFKELRKPTAAGLCASCHSVEKSAGNALAVNWKAFDRTKEPHGFTKFSHGPHLAIPQLADCGSCHTVDAAASAATAYTDLDPHRFASEFKPMSKQLCAECHTKTAAGDSCQSCHNYHVESVEAWRFGTPTDVPRARMAERLLFEESSQ